MKRNFLGFGIILLFAGVILFSYFNTPPVEVEKPTLLDEQWNSFDVSAEFNKSQKLLVFFHAPRWDEYPIPDPDTAIVDVDIYDPYENKTEFRVQFFKRDTPPELWLRSNDTGGLEVSLPLEGIVGITKYSGEYRAHIDEKAAMFYNSAPPPVLRIYVISVELDYPNSGFLFLGMGFMASGVVVSVWSARSPNRKASKRRG